MFSVLALVLLATADDCTEEQIQAIELRSAYLTSCMQIYCGAEEEGRRRLQDEEGLALYEKYSCTCSTCMDEMYKIQTACTACDAWSYVRPEEEDDQRRQEDEYDYEMMCVLDESIPLAGAKNFCAMMGGASEDCLQGTLNLTLLEEIVDEDGENVEVEIAECYTSVFNDPQVYTIEACAEVCPLIESQACGVKLTVASDSVPIEYGYNGAACFDSRCTTSDAYKILLVMQDMARYAPFLTLGEDDGGDDNNCDEEDGVCNAPLDVQSYFWDCDGAANNGGDDDVPDESEECDAFGAVGSGKYTVCVILAVLFAMTTLVMSLMTMRVCMKGDGAGQSAPVPRGNESEL